MPCLLLYGDSGIGKTMILEKFARQHPAYFDQKKGHHVRPVIVVQMPPAPDERRLYAGLLEALGAPFFMSDGLALLERLAIRMLETVTPQALIIDEVHHLLAGTAREQRRALNLLKFLANALRIAVVAVGTRDALQAVASDPQIVSRFEPMELPRWVENDGFRAFLLALVRDLPLRKASPLADRACTQLLLRRSEGITGRVCWIVGQAAEEAIRSGEEQIDVALLDRVSHGCIYSRTDVLRQLPICPAAFEDESVDSWLERVGREYGSSRARLLCATGIRQRLGPRRYPIDPIRPHQLPAIAALTGNSLTGLRRKAALSPPAWTIRARNDFIFCLHCHLADHFEPGPKHVRASWYSAGRVCCLIHRHWLWSARARFGCGRIDRSLREHEELPLSVWSEHFHAECTALDRIWESDPEVPLALRELESTIHAARRDVAPCVFHAMVNGVSTGT